MMQPSRPQTGMVDFYDGQTERMPAIRRQKLVLPAPRQTEPLLPLDEWCRPYLASYIRWDKRGLLWDDTVIQTIGLVEQYRKRSGGAYPTEIVLRAERYFVRRTERFYPSFDLSARPIPFRYESADAAYEILVRGKV